MIKKIHSCCARYGNKIIFLLVVLFVCIFVPVLNVQAIVPEEQWGANGKVLVTASDVSNSRIIETGNANFFIIWEIYDEEGIKDYDLYVQKFDSDGNPLTGVSQVAQGSDWEYEVKQDGSDGFYLQYWKKFTGEQHTDELYLQRIDSAGNKLWGDDGVLVGIVDTSWDGVPHMVSLESDGTAVIYLQGNAGYMQRLDTDGNKMWGDNGIQLSLLSLWPSSPIINIAKDTSNNVIGVMVQDIYQDTWWDVSQIVAFKLDLDGNQQWFDPSVAGGTGQMVTTAGQLYPENIRVVTDADDNVLVYWQEYRHSSSGYHEIYAQKLDAAGNRLWDDTDFLDDESGCGGTKYNLTSPANTLWSDDPDCFGQSACDYYSPLEDGGENLGWSCGTGNGCDCYWSASALRITYLDGYTDWLLDVPGFDSLMALSDGSGGFYLPYFDAAYEPWNIYIQHVSSDGDLMWDGNGIAYSNVGTEVADYSVELISTDEGILSLFSEKVPRTPYPYKYEVNIEHIDLTGEVNWGGYDRMVPENSQWCTNAGAVQWTYPAEAPGITDAPFTEEYPSLPGLWLNISWDLCWNWCYDHMSSDQVCQCNGDGPRNCWIRSAPGGDVSNCTWAEGVHGEGTFENGGSFQTTPTHDNSIEIASGIDWYTPDIHLFDDHNFITTWYDGVSIRASKRMLDFSNKNWDTGGLNESANAIVQDAQGKFYVTGYMDDGDDEMMLWRLTSTHYLDTSFNSPDGYVKLDYSGGDDEGYDVEVQSDGKIVVTGSVTNAGGDCDMAVWRFNTDGTLDTTLNGTGYVTFHNSAGGDSGEKGISLEIQSDGKYIIAGHSYVDGSIYSAMTIWRMNPDGTLDDTFGDGTCYNGATLDPTKGCVVNTLSSVNANSIKGFDVVIQNDGKYVVSGKAFVDGADGAAMVVWRYNLDGSPDTLFGAGSGFVSHDGAAGGTSCDKGWEIELQADQKIVVAGQSMSSSGTSDVVAWRFNSDGALDGTFGDGTCHNGVGAGGAYGCSTYDYDSAGDRTHGMKIAPDGKIVISGQSKNSSGTPQEVIWRYNTDGTMDSSFGNNTCVNGAGAANDMGCIVYSSDINTEGKWKRPLGDIAVVSSTEYVSVAGNKVGGGLSYDLGLWYYDIGKIGGLIINLEEELDAEDDQNATDFTVVRQFGTKTVRLEQNSGTRIMKGSVNLDVDRDWTGVTADIQGYKSLFHYSDPTCEPNCSFEDVPGSTDQTYTLYIPARSADSQVLICPGAADFNNVALGCANGQIFKEGQTKSMSFMTSGGVVESSVSVGKEVMGDGTFWVVEGVMSTGGVSINSIFPLKDTLTRLEVSVASDHTIEFGTVNGLLDVGDTIEIEFDPGGNNWNLGSLIVTDVTMDDAGGSVSLCTDTDASCDATATLWGVDIDSANGVITFTHPTDGANGDIPVNSLLVVKVGQVAGGSNQIVNPSVVAEYEITMKNTYGAGGDDVETGEVEIPIIDDDTVNITGYLDTVLSFDIDTAVTDVNCDAAGGGSPCDSHGSAGDSAGYVVDLGEMTLSTVTKSGDNVLHADGLMGNINYIWFDLESNANGGVVVTVVSLNEGLSGPGSNSIPSVATGSEQQIIAMDGLYGMNHRSGFTHSTVAGTVNIHTDCDCTSGDSYYCDVRDSEGSGDPIEVFNSNGDPVDDGRVQWSIGAAPDSDSGTGTYTDQLTFVATATF